MTTKKELIEQAKELKIKGYSKMTKLQLENVIFLKQAANWYDDLSLNYLINIDDQTTNITYDI